MLESYAYLCNLRKCKDCTFPECSHTTDKRYRCEYLYDTEMRLGMCNKWCQLLYGTYYS